MDSVLIVHLVTLSVLFCCRYGISYKIYILPEPGDFCLGLFSGDDCMTWSEYSANPTFADHSTTLIFAPGVYTSSRLSNRYSYSNRALSVANIKHLTMIGDAGAQLQFQLSLVHVGEVRLINLTFTNNPKIEARYVNSFMIEKCTLSQTSLSSSYYSTSVGVYFYGSSMIRVLDCTFVKVPVNVQQYSTRENPALLVDKSTFMNSSQRTSIQGDAYSSMIIRRSRFVNNYATSSGIVYAQGPLEVIDCLFDGNSAVQYGGAVVYSVDDVTVSHSRFIGNNASYYYGYRVGYNRGGSAIRGQRNININNCTFSFYTQTNSIINSYPSFRYHYYGYWEEPNEVYIVNSKFYDSSRSIYSFSNVTVVDSTFYSITANSGGGGVVYSTESVAITNCTFINSTAVYGNGGVIYSQQGIDIVDSILSDSETIRGKGGVLYSQEDKIIIHNCTISNSIAAYDGGAVYATKNIFIANTSIVNSESQSGRGGAIYGLDIEISNSNLSNTVANGNGGGMYATNNVIIANTSIVNSETLSGSGGAIYGFDIAISNSNLSNSVANGNGGGMYAANNVIIANTSIVNSETLSGSGGAIYGFDIAISNSNLSNSVANGNGGGIYSVNDVEITDCIMSECSAVNGSGGAIYAAATSYSSNTTFDSNIVISKSAFSHNTAAFGGVLYTKGHYNHYTRLVDSTFFSNKATGNRTGGGVCCVANTTLSILNSTFNENMAENDGGVMDLSYSAVIIKQCSFSLNSAGDKGGVFYGHHYSTNFTIVDAVLDHNSAKYGGVVYVRRSNSNIKIVRSKLVDNSASIQGGVMDIRGVSVTADMHTVIASNTAGTSGNVISACVCKITAYGVESRLDPVYPLYCSIYDEENNSSSHSAMSQSISTYHFSTVTVSPTGRLETPPQEISHATEVLSTTVSEKVDNEGITTIMLPKTTKLPPTYPLMATSDNAGDVVSTAAPTTERSASSLPLTYDSSAVDTSTGASSGHIMVTTAVALTLTSSSSPTTLNNDHKLDGSTSTKNSETTTTTDTIPSTSDLVVDSVSTHSAESMITEVLSGTTDSSITTQPGIVELQVEQEKFATWKSTQDNLLQVSIISLTVLCVVCIAVCIMMVTLFFKTCKRREVLTRGRYKKLSRAAYKDHGETLNDNEMEEYSVSEI